DDDRPHQEHRGQTARLVLGRRLEGHAKPAGAIRQAEATGRPERLLHELLPVRGSLPAKEMKIVDRLPTALASLEGDLDGWRTELMTEPYIQLQCVSKQDATKNGIVEACVDVNLDIKRSEFVAIVGPSGCGKTTILKMVAGLTPYSSGTITIGGARVNKPQTDVGIVFQDSIMLDWRDVLSNVMLQVDIRPMDRGKYSSVP